MSKNEDEFKEMAILAQNGNQPQYMELLRSISGFLRNYLRRRVYDKGEIEEVIQEILLAVHKSFHTYDSTQRFMGWLMAIVEYKIIDYLRSLKKRGKDNIEFSEASSSHSIPSDSELKMDIERAFKQLSPREQSVLSLIKLEGKSIAEAAEILQLSESNVKVIAHRAYVQLKK